MGLTSLEASEHKAGVVRAAADSDAGLSKPVLSAGKSAIHGWGAFAKTRHAAGDMVVEYQGEIVRASVADCRERRLYDTLVGAGTYVFTLNSDRQLAVDATRKGACTFQICTRRACGSCVRVLQLCMRLELGSA